MKPSSDPVARALQEHVEIVAYDPAGRRTHHIHCLEGRSSGWERLLFRDYLRAHPAAAQEYDALKRRIATEHPDDRKAYAKAKTGFIRRVMKAARRWGA